MYEQSIYPQFNAELSKSGENGFNGGLENINTSETYGALQSRIGGLTSDEYRSVSKSTVKAFREGQAVSRPYPKEQKGMMEDLLSSPNVWIERGWVGREIFREDFSSIPTTDDWILVDGIIEGIVEKIGFRSTTIRKFDKSLAIIPNFQFAENAVVNVSETSNWLISWVITLQYNTTVDQLKTIRNQIEDHINKSDDFNTAIGIAVRVDKFSDSSIDMYVRCFTTTDSWNEWLAVKERLALEIKQIVESNKASFAFPSSSIYIEKK